jgi:hypothetical protein
MTLFILKIILGRLICFKLKRKFDVKLKKNESASFCIVLAKKHSRNKWISNFKENYYRTLLKNLEKNCSLSFCGRRYCTMTRHLVVTLTVALVEG